MKLKRPSNLGVGFLTRNLDVTLHVSSALRENSVRDLHLRSVIQRDRSEVPARELTLKELLFKCYVRLNDIRQKYILEYFF